MDDVKVAVVGAGITGLSVALDGRARSARHRLRADPNRRRGLGCAARRRSPLSVVAKAEPGCAGGPVEVLARLGASPLQDRDPASRARRRRTTGPNSARRPNASSTRSRAGDEERRVGGVDSKSRGGRARLPASRCPGRGSPGPRTRSVVERRAELLRSRDRTLESVCAVGPGRGRAADGDGRPGADGAAVARDGLEGAPPSLCLSIIPQLYLPPARSQRERWAVLGSNRQLVGLKVPALPTELTALTRMVEPEVSASCSTGRGVRRQDGNRVPRVGFPESH